MSTKTRELVYLAGLLHDIGKFDVNAQQAWRQTPFYKELATTEAAIIERANTWATSIDLLNDSVTLEIKQPLRNLFKDVQIATDTAPVAKQSFGFHKLSLEEDVVLQKTPGDLAGLREAFSADFAKISRTNTQAFSQTLYHLLRQYVWCLPASVNTTFASISLFHHLKLAGAFSQCLYDYEQDKSSEKSKYPVQLLCVDLSGIQAFIYAIGSKYAAKSLKGRSFSLQLLLDSIARQLINTTETTPSHIIYSSGGKFFMLLPNTAAINNCVEAIERNIQQSVWDTYQGNLFVCFGSVAFDYEPESRIVYTDNGGGSLSSLWQHVTRKAAEQKVRKNSQILLDTEKFEDLFEPTGKGGQANQCVVTGWEGSMVTTKDGAKVHSTVKTQIDIGSELSRAVYLTLGEGKFTLLTDSGKNPESGFDLSFDLDSRTDFGSKTEYSLLVQPGKDNSFLTSTTFGHVVKSFRFYGGSQQARSVLDERAPKTFEELAGIVRHDPDLDSSPILHEKSEGNYNRLAVLRMDVDNLGKLFTHGFAPERATFSAYATLSGLLDWFFSGYLNTIRDRPAFRDWVNIIYSGGDDVFAVGRWDRIIGFAEAVQKDFKTFTGRSDLTISAGIELMRPRFPIGKAADAAGEAEDVAKNFNKDRKLSPGRHEKDAVCLFGIAIGWDEFAIVRLVKEQWDDWLTNEVLSKGILRSMFDWYEVSTRKDRQTNKPLNDQSWRWNAAYSLARQRTRDPDTPKNQALDTLKLVLMVSQFKDETGKVHPIRFEAFIVACRWAELTYRDKLNNN